MQDLEKLSTEELREQIKEDKKQAKRSTVMAASALVAIITLCIAWFVGNNLVKGTSSQVSAQSDIAYKLASVGTTRQDDNKLNLNNGDVKKYEKYYDTENGQEINESQSYHEGTAGLAWYMNGQERMSPGASGKLEFYVIPQHDGGKSVELTLDLAAYVEDKNTKKAIESEVLNVQNLVKGHILFFRNLDNKDGYSDWCYDKGKNKIIVNAPEGGFKAKVPYKVTVYWVWPKYFRNYIYNSRDIYGDLFVNKESEDAKKVLKFVQEDEGQQLLFSDAEGGKTSQVENISAEMSDEIWNTCNKYYNQADEWLGSKTDFIYINATLN